MRLEEEVYFEQGWPKFVKDYALVDGDFMTFVYNGDNIFKVSIYGLDGCKQARAVAEVKDDDEEEEDRKSKGEVIKEESDGKEDSDHSLNNEDKERDTGS
ncbi:hypothetical protein YC2023_044540 [Brassica napus]